MCAAYVQKQRETEEQTFRIIFSSTSSVLESVQMDMQIFPNKLVEEINNCLDLGIFGITQVISLTDFKG